MDLAARGDRDPPVRALAGPGGRLSRGAPLVILRPGVRLGGQAFGPGPPRRRPALQPGDLSGPTALGLLLAGRFVGVAPCLILLAADDLVSCPRPRARR